MSDPELYSATELQRLTGYARAADLPDFDEWKAGQIRPYIITPDVEVIRAGEYPEGGDAEGVYMLFDKEGGVLYVGMSYGIGYRVIQHLWASGRGQRGRFVEYGFVAVPCHLMAGVEAAHIEAMRPPENHSIPPRSWRWHDEAVEMIQAAWGSKR